MRFSLIVLTVIAAIVILFAGLWVWVLASHNPLNNPAAKFIPFPVACSTRGCITTLDWRKEMQILEIFTRKTKKQTPTPKAVLTVLIHQHLAHFGQLRNPIKIADAQQYRESILNLKNPEAIREATGLSVDDYDKLVVIPFLEQESLRQQLSVNSTDELYKKLAKERFVLILPFRLK